MEKRVQTDMKRPRCPSDSFCIEEKLGEGSFGTVHKAQHKKEQKMYALKKSKKPIWATNHRTQCISEITHAQDLGVHRNIAQVISAWEEGGHIYIQMELAQTSLKDILANTDGNLLNEDTIWRYLSDIIHGILHMHNSGIVHLDIKPENILLGFDNVLKISDFGISARVEGNKSHSQDFSEGDKLYMAPELLVENYGRPADIFSLGITLYEMATGFALPERGTSWHNLRSGIIEFPEDINLSMELKTLITNMMHPDPSCRPVALEVASFPNVASYSIPTLLPSSTSAPRKRITPRKLFEM